MKKWFIFFPIFILLDICYSIDTQKVFNEYTRKPDYITSLSTANIQGGTGISVSTNSTGVVINATGNSVPNLAVGTGSSSSFTNNITSPTAASPILRALISRQTKYLKSPANPAVSAEDQVK